MLTLVLSLSTSDTANAFALYPKQQGLAFSRPAVGRSSSLFLSNNNDHNNNDHVELLTGPTVSISDNGQDAGAEINLELQELGIVLSVAESAVCVGTLGLFARISDSVEETTLPALTLLGGYSKGTFHDEDEGDKTVGFSLFSMDAPVFFNRQLMTIEQALAASVATETKEVKIAGHDVLYDEIEKKIIVWPSDDTFARYFVPNDDDEMNVTNVGQYCNDRAFERGIDRAEYQARCETNNCVRLAWRLEFDEQENMLKPSWPVSILSKDLRFSNREPIELGTTYGWNYWDATIELDRL
jgi:hypothetical protein